MKRICNPNLPIVKEGWRGNIVIDGKFQNGAIPRNFPFADVFKWQFSRNPQRKEKRDDAFELQIQNFNPSAMQNNSIVWLGHASFLMKINGARLIIDPCFFKTLIPIKRNLPCSPDSLKSINYLLVSHDHRDHFDKKSVKILVENNPEIEALIPLGGSRLFSEKALRNVKIQEAGWYQEYKLGYDIRIIFLPAKHWGRRALRDANKTLWGSFLIIAGDTKIFFAGDTAYDELLFKEIQNLFGDIDVCLLPIGAYSPQWFMSESHTNPEEAAQIFLDLGGKVLIPMHYGTYDLSDEPPSEPIKRLRKYAVEKEITHKVKELAMGEEFLITNKEKESLKINTEATARQPQTNGGLSKEQVLEHLKSNEVSTVTNALLYATLNFNDWIWIQDECLKLANHQNVDIKGLAVTCLGHLARIHSSINKAKVLPVLFDKLNDKDISGRAQDALDDIKMFAT
ncbi:MAG: MBL fold metallo-hydrolase [Helicobacteraceae bacterium]|jgi:L-ascorbate metabolism protein UlaG (beta-lactamase superfamily)|nr:MBL fold metallo-hydrolase [Helicobacteraceae bacterium]